MRPSEDKLMMRLAEIHDGALSEVATRENILSMYTTLMDLAKTGDMPAVKTIIERVKGPPRDEAVTQMLEELHAKIIAIEESNKPF